MARDGLRKAVIAPLALAGLVGVAGMGSIGADAATAPVLAFIDKNSDGLFTEGQDEYVNLNERQEVAIELTTEGFVIPSSVKLTVDTIHISSESGRVEVGPNVKLTATSESYDPVSIIGGRTVIGDGAKLKTKSSISVDAVTEVAIGDGASFKAPELLEIGAGVDSLVIGENVLFHSKKVVREDGDTYVLGEVSMDPKHNFVIGAGSRFIAGGVDIGVGAFAPEGDSTHFEIRDGVVFSAAYDVQIFAFEQMTMVYSADTKITAGGNARLVAENGPLAIPEGKIKAASAQLLSNHSVALTGTDVILEDNGILTIGSYNGAQPKTGSATISESKIDVGENGLLDVLSNTASIDVAEIKPELKTVVINGQGSGPRSRRLTVDVNRYRPDSVVTITPSGIECRQGSTTCTAVSVVNRFARVTPSGTPGTVGGACNPSNGSVTMSADKVCTLTFP